MTQSDEHENAPQPLPQRAVSKPARDAGRPQDPPVRAGENPRLWFRTKRVFAVGDLWYFATRENIDVGPYPTREEAEREVQRLAKILATTHSEAEARLTIEQFRSRPRAGYTPD